MRQKKQMKMLGLLGLLAALPIISACAGNKGSDESRKKKWSNRFLWYSLLRVHGLI